MSEQSLFFVGTYTEAIEFGTGQVLGGKGGGIYAYSFGARGGEAVPLHVTEGVINPSYLAFDPPRRFLYAVNEGKTYQGAATGAVSAFAVERGGRLRFLNKKPSHGADPCHLAVDPSGARALVANFASGSVSVLPIRADGSLGDASDTVQHEGSSLDPARQRGPHAHAVTLGPAGRFVYVPDLGLDRVMIYELTAQGTLEAAPQPFVATKPGAGPRQLVFCPSGHHAYLINELNSTLSVYRHDPETGRLEEVQTLSALPADFNGDNTCAEVQLAPSGRFLYGSNRGHDSIAIFAVDEVEGALSLIGHEPCGGKTPRHFTLSPRGDSLLVANQDSDTVVIFECDEVTGKLTATGQVLDVPTPVCVKFA